MKQATPTYCIALLALGVNAALAEAPTIQSPTPVIHLADNLDEADKLGWCIDTVGRGLSDRLHAHSCKPQGGDVQFRLDTDTDQIISVAFDTKCAEHAGRNEPLALVDCNREDNAQRFLYDAEDMVFHPEGAPDLCLTVGGSSRSAGPFMSRDLLIQDCNDVEETHRAWVIRS